MRNKNVSIRGALVRDMIHDIMEDRGIQEKSRGTGLGMPIWLRV